MSDDLSVSVFNRIRNVYQGVRERLGIAEQPPQVSDQALPWQAAGLEPVGSIQTMNAGQWEQDAAGEMQDRTLVGQDERGLYAAGLEVSHADDPENTLGPTWSGERFATMAEAEVAAGIMQTEWHEQAEHEIDMREYGGPPGGSAARELTDTTARDRWDKEVEIVDQSTMPDEDKKRAIGLLGQAPPVVIGEERDDGLSVDGHEVARLDRQTERAIEDGAPDKGIGYSQDLPEHERTADENNSLGLEL